MVAPLVGGDGVVQPRRPVDGAVDAGVQDDQREEGDDDERERVGDHHVVTAEFRKHFNGGICEKAEGWFMN